MFQILYKRTSIGKIQRWQQEIDGNRYRTISGQVDGKLVTSEWTVVKGKNIGKANETTPEEQCISEVQSNYTRKLEQNGYREKIKDIDTPNFFKPMLAKDFHKYEPTEEMYEQGLVFSQSKLDGMRCIANKDGLWSRAGKPILSVPHIHDALKPIFEETPEIIFDGELYASKLNNDFNKLMSLCKQKKPTAEDFKASAKVIQYWIYDLPSQKGGFEVRTDKLYEVLFQIGNGVIVFHETTLVKDIKHLDSLNRDYLASGTEGQIVRIAGTDYENKRTKSLLKRKDFMDREYTIVDIQEGSGNRSGMAGNIVYDLGDGKTFSSNITGGMDFYRHLLQNASEYIGGEGTVKYFELTPDGIPRFPVTIAVYKGKRDS